MCLNCDHLIFYIQYMVRSIKRFSRLDVLNKQGAALRTLFTNTAHYMP